MSNQLENKKTHDAYDALNGIIPTLPIWLITTAVIMLVLSFVGIVFSPVTTLYSMTAIGSIMVATGIYYFIKVFKKQSWQSRLFKTVTSILYSVAGVIIAINPFYSAIWLTLVLAITFISAGIIRLYFAIKNRKEISNVWLVAISGIASILLGVMIYYYWPVNSLWFIGAFISIEFMIQAFSMMYYSIALKKNLESVTNAENKAEQNDASVNKLDYQNA